jgi:hypothetical protein
METVMARDRAKPSPADVITQTIIEKLAQGEHVLALAGV